MRQDRAVAGQSLRLDLYQQWMAAAEPMTRVLSRMLPDARITQIGWCSPHGTRQTAQAQPAKWAQPTQPGCALTTRGTGLAACTAIPGVAAGPEVNHLHGASHRMAACCLSCCNLQEDAALSARVAKYGTKSWTTIAAGVEGRSAVRVCAVAPPPPLVHMQCLHVGQHATPLLAPLRGPPANSFGQSPVPAAVAWSCCCPDRTLPALFLFLASPQKSCRLRWYNQLCPGVKRTPFSEWEQAVIIKVRACVLAWSASPALSCRSRCCALSCRSCC